MRLTTLARKIDKTPNQLISFLNEKGIDTSSGLHGKLDEEVVAMVLDSFLPESDTDEISKPEVIEEKNNVDDDVSTVNIPDSKQIQDDAEEEKLVEEPIPSTNEADEPDVPALVETNEIEKTGTVDDLEIDNLADIGLIKAKKVKLEGIKVVGKIELKEKPKKVIEGTSEPEEENKNIKNEEKLKTIRKPENRKFDRRKKTPIRKKAKTLSYEDRLKNEEREKLKLRRRREKAEKERKKKYYLKNIQPKINATQKSKNTKKNPPSIPVKSEKAIVHKNPFKRLWAWLNGQYDSY